jgi:hypothetical protein
MNAVEFGRPAVSTTTSARSTTLAHDRLGVAAVVFFVISAAAPLTVVAGVVPIGLAVTGLTGISIAFLAVAAVLAIFAVVGPGSGALLVLP